LKDSTTHGNSVFPAYAGVILVAIMVYDTTISASKKRGFQPVIVARTPSPQSSHTIMSKTRVLGVISAICAIAAATNVVLQVPFLASDSL
ncbi:hypothetical protein CGSMWGv1400E_01812, partial [Gardnerella vaginalis 1400E]